MTVLFQAHSVLLTILGWRHVVRAQEVIFFQAHWIGHVQPTRWRKWCVERLIHWLNPHAEVVELEPETVSRMGYQNNFESDRYVEEVFHHVRKSPSYQVIRELIGDPHIDRFYKIRLIPQIIWCTQYYRTIHYLRQAGRLDVAIPGAYDPYGLHRYFLTDSDLTTLVPWVVRRYLRWRYLVARVWSGMLLVNWLYVLAVPLRCLARMGRRGVSRLMEPVEADVIKPLVWGVNEDGVSRGLRTGFDDTYILGGELNPARVAFYFSEWTFTPEEEQVQRNRMQQRHIRYFDPRQFRLTTEYLHEAVGLCWQLWRQALRRPAMLAEERCVARLSAAFFATYLRELLFARQVTYKVAVEYQDYSSTHVVRTIVANKLGRLTVGMHHGAPDGPYGFPTMRYTHINRHCVWGDAFRRLHGAHWDHMTVCPVGAYRVDLVIEAQREDRLRVLRRRFNERYGGARPLVVILFASLESYNLRRRLQEELEGLRLLRTLPNEFVAVCRFRSVELAQRYQQMGLDEILQRDPRIRIDLSEFTTYEWFALSDVVIVSGTSTGMIEAASAGKPCFTFDNKMLAEVVFAPYGRDLTLKTRHDVVRVFQNISTGFQGFDCNWDRLAKDHNYFSDGHNIDRFRQAILDAVRDAGAGQLTEVDRRELRSQERLQAVPMPACVGTSAR